MAVNIGLKEGEKGRGGGGGGRKLIVVHTLIAVNWTIRET